MLISRRFSRGCEFLPFSSPTNRGEAKTYMKMTMRTGDRRRFEVKHTISGKDVKILQLSSYLAPSDVSLFFPPGFHIACLPCLLVARSKSPSAQLHGYIGKVGHTALLQKVCLFQLRFIFLCYSSFCPFLLLKFKERNIHI